MVINIAIVDDLPNEIKRISDVIQELCSENHVSIKLNTFSNAEDFLADYHPFQYTMIFMDIYMDGMNGIDAAKKIRECDKDTPLIFLTTSTSHAFDAFDVHAYQYIIKGADNEAIKASICQVLDDILSMRSALEEALVFSIDGVEKSLAFSNIIYIHSQKNYIMITDRYQNSSRIRMTFSEISTILEQDSRFLRINRGIIINMDYITAFSNGFCHLQGGYQLPVHLRNYKKLDQIRQNYIFSKLHKTQTIGGRL